MEFWGERRKERKEGGREKKEYLVATVNNHFNNFVTIRGTTLPLFPPGCCLLSKGSGNCFCRRSQARQSLLKVTFPIIVNIISKCIGWVWVWVGGCVGVNVPKSAPFVNNKI